MLSNKGIALSVLLASTSTLAVEAAAQSIVDEIVVTATRTERNVQDVGISVSAFSGDQLRSVGITDSTQIVQITPGLQNPQSNSGFSSSFSIRGITQSDFGASQEAPVALYVDDVYQSNQAGAMFQLFDVERVEVLRGPQGTLFGRNATGGLVHFLTKKPSQETSGYVDLSYGSFDRVKAEGAVGVPLSDAVAIRVSGVGDFHDEIVDNRFGPDVWDREEFAGRVQVLFEPTSDIEFLLSARGASRRNTGTPYHHQVATPTGIGGTGVFAPPGSVDFLGFAEPDSDPFTVGIDDVSNSQLGTFSVSGNLVWSFDGVTLTSITDFTSLDVDFTEDSDIQPGEFFHFVGRTNFEQFSQELRLNGDFYNARWTFGAYYLNLRGDYDQRGLITDLGFGVDQQIALYEVDTDSYSVFGQFEFDLTDQLTFTAGARWILDDKSQTYENFFVIDGVPGKIPFGLSGAPNLIEFSDSDSESIYSVRAQIDYDVTDDVLLYASFNRGVKGFGYNAPVDPSGSPLFIDPITFDPVPGADDAFRFEDETLNAFEIGFKSSLFDGLARLNMSAFYYDYDNYQALNLVGITQIITNNDARMFGFEAELFANPYEGLDLVLGAAYLDTEVEDVNVGGVLLDREVAYAPSLNLTGLARYEWNVANGLMAVQANVSYTGDHFLGLTNAAVLEEDGYILANARVSYTLPGAYDYATVSFFVNNLTDKEYRTLAFDTSAFFGSVESQVGRPREFGGQLSLAF